jgi:hypothetical protein
VIDFFTYDRVPLSSFQEPSFHDIDLLLDVLHKIDFSSTDVIFFDQRGNFKNVEFLKLYPVVPLQW